MNAFWFGFGFTIGCMFAVTFVALTALVISKAMTAVWG